MRLSAVKCIVSLSNFPIFCASSAFKKDVCETLSALLTEVKERRKVDGVRVSGLKSSTSVRNWKEDLTSASTDWLSMGDPGWLGFPDPGGSL